ncbi:MAG TPA: 4-hydroxy-tetrahydrodipicolinate reductase [Usitatibacter sp.]|jgi:4-hydroxy-tetrahydrodipicolinate reductase|nr:4-hydroxy-tetrahydrodipicolinate reductase [Usitatibacter sp.]
MSVVRVALAGAGGRMGRALLEAASATPGIAIGAALDAAGSSWIGRDAGDLVAAAKGIVIAADMGKALAACDVLVDFTRPEGTLAHLRACRAAKKAMVIGTTGFAPAGLQEIRAAAGDIAIVMAPNMSIGVNVMAKLVELASRTLGADYDAEVFEIHHNKKVDAPSGTALMLGAVAAKARGGSIDKDAVHARHGDTGERRSGSVGFSVARGGDVVGDHTVYFAGTGERIEITHRSSSRATYAQGAMRAAKFAAARAPGLYGMDDVLGLASAS